MIIQETVLVGLKSQSICYYESLGYFIPKIFHKKSRISVKRGTKIKVKVSDLPKKSHVKVLCKCDECGKERSIRYKEYRSLCNNCSKNTPEARLNNSKRQLGKCLRENNPNWNPTLTKEDREYNRHFIGPWSRKVKQRDQYTCQCCGYTGEVKDGFMNAHHINNYATFKEQRTDVDNGITLCKDCHKLLHNTYGLKTTKENLNEFIILYCRD